MSYFMDTKTIDQNEVPKGYIAILKKDLKSTDNICNHCDWRKDCKKSECSCMGYDRKDGCSVYFKKIN